MADKLPPSSAASGIDRLLNVMASLRDPDGGCPWDLEQSYKTITPYTIEEAYEVADAIEREDFEELKFELGDLLFQVVFYSQIATEDSRFTFDDVANAISDKMIERHPHVFGDVGMRDASEQTVAWEAQKAAERAKKSDTTELSALAGVARTLPSMIRAQKLQKRAARVGFDWPEPSDIFAKLEEEIGELKEAMTEGDQRHIDEELGDMLFVVVNLCRKLGTDAEEALKMTNKKFETRFKLMEDMAQENGESFEALDLDAQEALWTKAKRELKTKT